MFKTGQLPILYGTIFLLGTFGVPVRVMAGGPKYVAGVAYFNPAVLGSPIHWQGGAVRYYVDQGPLNAQVSNQQATAMVDAAAALWNAVPTAGVSLKNMGSLNEDVSGNDMVAGNASFGQPADAGGVTVTFTLMSGNANLACGSMSCPVSAAGDGVATMNVSALGTGISIVRASLTNGANLEAHFSGGAPGIVTALTPSLSIAAGASVNWTTQAIVLNNGKPMVGQSVAWQTVSGITTAGGKVALTDSGGVATKSLVVGPLNEGQQATSTACVNGTLQCANFTAIGARPEYAYLEAIAGTTQCIAAGTTPNQITLRLRDMDGNPMAAGTVTLYQALYAWAPPCPPRGRCAQPELLVSQVSTATSALDGTVSFAPATLPGVPSNLIGLAVTGSSSTLPIDLEQNP